MDAKFGSSPHTWGIPASALFCSTGFRFIPTYVGHTGQHPRLFPEPPVHPHIRGAYGQGHAPCVSENAVHPHIRGAYPPAVGWSLHLHGSSPHTWGIRCRENHRICSTRFIPTYVGHTVSRILPGGMISVHPHIRGAYWVSKMQETLEDGSSPHTWGILGRGACDRGGDRFIPTYVGHTRGDSERV